MVILLIDKLVSVTTGNLVNIHPVLLAVLVLVGPAYQVAPPVAVESLIDKKPPFTNPLDLLKVAGKVREVQSIVTRLPEIPATLKLVTV